MCCQQPCAAKRSGEKGSLGTGRQEHKSFCIGFHSNNPPEQFREALIKASGLSRGNYKRIFKKCHWDYVEKATYTFFYFKVEK